MPLVAQATLSPLPSGLSRPFPMKCGVIPGGTQRSQAVTSLTFKLLRDDADIIWEWSQRFLIAIALRRKCGGHSDLGAR